MSSPVDPVSPTGHDIASEKFVSLTTYKRDGSAKSLPVWIVGLPDGRLGFTTSPESWKAKRVANDPRVTLRRSDQRGKVVDGAMEVTGTAVVTEGDEFGQVQALIDEKYGCMVKVVKLVNRFRSLIKRDNMQSSAAMIVTLD